MIWVLEWDYPGDGDSNVSLWDTEENACKQACADIIDYINDHFSLANDPDHYQAAKEIQDYIDNGEYAQAVKHWNYCDANCDSERRQFWTVYKRDTLDDSHVSSFHRIEFPYQKDEDEGEDEDERVVNKNHNDSARKAFIASKHGATCRGCKQYNEYAYADNSDDTYECYSCKSYHRMF